MPRTRLLLVLYSNWPKKTVAPFRLWKTAETLMKPCVSVLCQEKLWRVQHQESYDFQENVKNLGKMKVCGNLAVVRRTEPPPGRLARSFEILGNPLEIIGNPCISCGRCGSCHRGARRGSSAACEILRLSRKPYKTNENQGFLNCVARRRGRFRARRRGVSAHSPAQAAV